MENFIEPPSELRRVFGNSDRLTEKSTSAAQPVTSIGADGSGVPCIVGSFHCLPRNPRPSAGAERMRRWRLRKQRGQVVISLEISPHLVDGLIRGGWLDASKHCDKEAIAAALVRIAQRAI
jgi:hypothetical protein